MAIKRTEEPHDLRTKICNDIADKVADHPDFKEGMRVVILCTDDRGGGIGACGYPEDEQEGARRDVSVVVDMFMALRAMMRANGKDLHVLPVGDTPPDERA